MIDQALREAEQKMSKAVEVAKDDFAAIRTGRAHPQMFAGILADYYGSPTPLQQLAGFQVPEPRTVLISPYDKGAMAAIEKAIRDSDLGVNPGNDGAIIRVVMPALTEERRKEYIKLARHKGEEAKVSIRNVRRHAVSRRYRHLSRVFTLLRRCNPQGWRGRGGKPGPGGGGHGRLRRRAAAG